MTRPSAAPAPAAGRPISRRTLLRRTAALAAAPWMAACDSPAQAPAAAGPARLALLGEARWPHALPFGGTTVGGRSGADFDARTGEYLLLSDDRADRGPVRFYTAEWPDQAPAPRLTDVVPLQQAGGTPWPNRRRAPPGVPVADPEALRLRPGTGTLLWSTEGDVARGFGPALYESARDGRLLREFALPAMFRPDPSGGRGPRDNEGFEGLATTPDGRFAWLAMEGALVQDGPLPTVDDAGGPCRFTRVDLAGGRAVRQIAYVPDAVPLRPAVPGTYADNGVSEVLMIDAHRMLVLERAWALGRGNSLRLYEIDTRAGSDTLALDTLRPGNHRPAPKRLLADFARLGLARLDNTEALCWGPPLPDGRRRLLAVSDDNFNPTQITQFAVFAFTDPPSP
ncbi:esterase-like activity of phytase family protein [Xenophilus sp.]|uniref:esterase-like activity of phytase family protein n=1 Tax=Xenophilus sp. TaxID=1873499 RepID=UPI0037DDCE06